MKLNQSNLIRSLHRLFSLMNNRRLTGFFNPTIFLLLVWTQNCLAQPCLFVADGGKVMQVSSLDQVPPEYRSKAHCSSKSVMAAPKEIELEGNLHKANITSALGPINLRWPRQVESLFGRTPERAMAEAAQAASRAMKRGYFPPEVERMFVNWDVVFMDEEVPETQIPRYLVDNCHPAWMTPEANIYVVAQRVLSGCSGKSGFRSSQGDAQLAQILVHEIGHAIEYKLLAGARVPERLRSEGFATWFEQYAAENSSTLNGSSISNFYDSVAKRSFREDYNAQMFAGGVEDYALSSMYFKAIVKRRGVRGLVDVYRKMSDDGIGFFESIDRVLGWNRNKLNVEVQDLF